MFRIFKGRFIKTLILSVVVLLFLAFIIYRVGIYPEREEGISEIPPVTEDITVHFSKAPDHIGEDLWVRGVVDHVFFSNNGNYFLNFCPDFRECPFNGVIFSEYSHLFEGIDSWSGQEIYIYGKIETYEGRPQTVIKEPEQVISDTDDISKEGVIGAEDTSCSGKLVEVVDVVDGDTVWVEIDGVTESVRLIGIDAPETEGPHSEVECYGSEAKSFLKDLLDRGSVIIKAGEEASDRDQYGRLLRYIYLSDGRSVNGLMVEEGYAFVYTDRSFEKMEEFLNFEEKARSEGLGMWGRCEYLLE